MQACQIQMPQSLLRQRNLQGRNRYQRALHLQRKASSQQMNDTPGNLLNTTTGLLLTVKVQGLYQAIGGRSSAVPQDKQADTTKRMDPVGLTVSLFTSDDRRFANSNNLTRRTTNSQGQHQEGISRNTINSQQVGYQLEEED